MSISEKAPQVDSEYTLRSTEDPTEIGWTNDASFTAFGKNLTRELYIRREQALYAHEFSRTSYTYLLQKPDNPYLCSCENFTRPIYYTEEADDGSIIVREGKIGGIATVFTPEKNRKNGYASVMMKKVMEDCKERLALTASSLYSDIGPKFYETFGWRTYPSRQLRLTVQSIDSPSPKSSFPTRLLTLSESVTLMPLDNHLLITRDLPAAHARLRATTPTEKTIRVAAVGVTAPSHEWFATRGNFYAREVGHMSDEQVNQMAYGVVVGSLPASPETPQTSPYAFALLFLDVKTPEAFVVRMRVEPGEGTPEQQSSTARTLCQDLLRAVCNELRRLKIADLKIWSPESKTGLVEAAAALAAEVPGGIEYQVQEREDELSCFSWFGPDCKEVKDWEEGKMIVEWYANEKYTWC
ncbi:hypothetical protein HDU93_007172 [Gonapodya sp. JEL0774]|nr:hypothetical protein HDU93_007172 [Gonapodya sp. JEL0774]